jgi:hypothetical protein
LSSDPRALRRLRSACARIEETPATVAEVLLEIDNLYEGIDFTFAVTQALFSDLWDRHYRSNVPPEPFEENRQDAPVMTPTNVTEDQKADITRSSTTKNGDSWALVLASSIRPLINEDWEVHSNMSEHSNINPLVDDPAPSFEEDTRVSDDEVSAPSRAESCAPVSSSVQFLPSSPRIDHADIDGTSRAQCKVASLSGGSSPTASLASDQASDTGNDEADVSMLDTVSEDAFRSCDSSSLASSHTSVRSTRVPRGATTKRSKPSSLLSASIYGHTHDAFYVNRTTLEDSL